MAKDDHLEDLEIFLSKEPFGSGAYSEVYEGSWMGIICAVKVFKPEVREYETKYKKILDNEAKTWRSLRHPSIVLFYGLHKDPRDIMGTCIVLEYLPHDLYNFINNRQDSQLRKEILATVSSLAAFKGNILKDVASALRYLHTIQITHGDLTPSNILLTHTYRAKVTDFGQAKFYDNLDRLSPSTVNYSTLKGTRDFMPPELLTDKPLLRVDKDAIDPFSFACVTLFVLTHEWPSPVNKYRCKGNTITKVLTELERREYYIRKLSEEENKQFKHLLEVCLHDNPNMRKKPKWIHDYLKKRCNYDRKVPEHPDRQQDLSTVTVSRDSEWNDTESDVHNETSPTLLAQKSPSVQNGNYCKQHQNKLSLQQNTSTETVAGDSKLSNSEVDEDKRLSSHTTSFNTFNLPPSPPEKSSLVQSSNTYSGQQLRNSADSISLNMYTVIMSIILAVLLAWLTKMSMKYYFF